MTEALQTGAEAGGGRRSRHSARRLLVQALYQWQLGGHEVTDLIRQLLVTDNASHADRDYFAEQLREIIRHHSALSQQYGSCLDRPEIQLDPVERAVLLLGTQELTHCLEVPARVAISEAVKLAKTYGATASHRYINGVMDRLAKRLRPDEMRSQS